MYYIHVCIEYLSIDTIREWMSLEKKSKIRFFRLKFCRENQVKKLIKF